MKKPSEDVRREFVHFRNNFKRKKNDAIRTYYSTKFSSCIGDSRKIWSTINSIINKGRHSSASSSFVVGDIVIDDPLMIADGFNEFFVNIGAHLSSSIPERKVSYDNIKFPTVPLMSFQKVTPLELIAVSKSIKCSGSPGTDNICPHLGFLSVGSISIILTDLINCSLSTGYFPDILKIAKVVPIHKSGDKAVFNNYRPISILPYFSKLFEKIVFRRLYDYFNSHGLLNDCQYGFRKGYSTYMAITNFHNKILKDLDCGMYSIGLFFDLSKAFDTVDHGILLDKLNHYGVSGACLKWLKNYLYKRKQFVSYNGVNSSPKSISCGVPQGSILGPLLFIIYINDIVSVSTLFEFTLYADDTNVLASDYSLANLIHNINRELICISDWFIENRLSLNMDKTCFIVFHNPQRKIDIGSINLCIRDIQITNVSCTKFLGLCIDQHITWNDHIGYISLKISKNIGVLYKISWFVPSKILLLLYYSLIYPYLIYCNFIWCTNYKSRTLSLAILQNRVLKIIFRLPFSSSVEPAATNVLSIDQICIYQSLLFMYRYHNNLLPHTLSNLFSTASLVHSHNTRSIHDYRSTVIHSTLKMYSIGFFGPRFWNSLSSDYRTLTIDAFKRAVKRLIMSKHFCDFLPLK